MASKFVFGTPSPAAAGGAGVVGSPGGGGGHAGYAAIGNYASTIAASNSVLAVGGAGGTGGPGYTYASGNHTGGNGGAGGAGGGAYATYLTVYSTTGTVTDGATATGGAGGSGGAAGTGSGTGTAGGAGNGGVGGSGDAYASATNAKGIGKAKATATGGPGGVASGTGTGGAGGAATVSSAYAFGTSAYAALYATGGAGGTAAAGTGGAGGGVALTGAVTGHSTGLSSGEIRLHQQSAGGAGGASASGTGGQGGMATSDLVESDTTAPVLLAFNYAYGGAGGASESGTGGAGGAATITASQVDSAFVATGPMFYSSLFVDAHGGKGGIGTGAGHAGGAGGAVSVAAPAAGSIAVNSVSSADNIVYAAGGAGGAGYAGAAGGMGAAVALDNAVSGSGTRDISLQQNAVGGAGGKSAGGAGGAGGAASSALSALYTNPVSAPLQLVASVSTDGGAGGAATGGGTGGAGGNANASISASLATSFADSKALFALAGGYGGAGGAGGGGGAAGSTTVAENAALVGTGTAVLSGLTADGSGSGTGTIELEGSLAVGSQVSGFSPFPVLGVSATAAALPVANGTTPGGEGPPASGYSVILAANPTVNAQLGTAGTLMLGGGVQQGGSATTVASAWEAADTITYSIDTAGLNGELWLGLTGETGSGSGFGTLTYSVAVDGVTVFSLAPASLSEAEADFSDTLHDLGAVIGGTTMTVALTFDMESAATAGSGFGGQFLLGVVPCFAAGTRIGTTRGEINVEDLREGDEVRTRDGVQPVVWIGRRRIDLARHPNPERARPIKIRRHAFGRDVPARDLLVSPDHAVFYEGVLIPARLLVNARTVVQVRPRAVTYFHVELPRHDILFAEGLAAESYLDTGNRCVFEGAAALVLHPDFSVRRWDQTCVPMVLGGERLAAARRHLDGRAAELGYRTTGDPDLHLVVDGRRTRRWRWRTNGCGWRFRRGRGRCGWSRAVRWRRRCCVIRPTGGFWG